MQQQRLVVQNESGVHLRVAQQIVEASRRQSAQVMLHNGRSKADGRSIFEVLMLGAVQGAEIDLIVSGGDEGRALRELSEVFMGGAGI